ncbi:MAG TPA: MBL fold metallo-hydrolase [Thermoanaerobaculia bacterium]|nr:MBL fold metallo-hydrolase [Thermoanaerobaculia bacterium]
MTNLLLSLAVILLGTGYPRPDANHAGPATAIVAGDKWFLVDAGRGATMRVAATPLQYENLRGVFITHLHSDHTAGLPDVFITSWQFGRKSTPLPLYGPAGIRQLADAMLRFFAVDIHIRRDLVEKHPAAGATIATHVVRQGVVYDDGDVRVTAFAVEHPPVAPAFGYRFDSGGHAIVVSGDTRPNANLIRFAKGADILVQEAYLPEHFDRVDKPDVAAKLKAYHTTAEEAGEIATAAGVKTLVLTHLVPAGAQGTFAERAAKTFHGQIIVGDDLKTITINGDTNASHN